MSTALNQVPPFDLKSLLQTVIRETVTSVTEARNSEIPAPTSISFGLANAHVIFQRMIYTTVGPLVYSIALAQTDNILIPTRTFNEGLNHLEQVVKVLRSVGLKLKLSKYKYLHKKVTFLHMILRNRAYNPAIISWRVSRIFLDWLTNTIHKGSWGSWATSEDSFEIERFTQHSWLSYFEKTRNSSGIKTRRTRSSIYERN